MSGTGDTFRSAGAVALSHRCAPDVVYCPMLATVQGRAWALGWDPSVRFPRPIPHLGLACAYFDLIGSRLRSLD
jgi:hypothetical protein